MHWKFGGNLAPVQMICEINWKDCPRAIANYLWSEVVTDVLDCFTNEEILWRVLLVFFFCILSLRLIHSKARGLNTAVLDKEILTKVGYKVEDLELKVNILTYKMQYGTWPVPHEIQKLGFKGLRNVRLTLSDPSDRNEWLKNIFLSPQKEESQVSLLNYDYPSTYHLHELFDAKSKKNSFFSRDFLPTSNMKFSKSSTDSKSFNCIEALYRKQPKTCKSDQQPDGQRQNDPTADFFPKQRNFRSSGRMHRSNILASRRIHREKLAKTMEECKWYLRELHSSNKNLGLTRSSSEMSITSSSGDRWSEMQSRAYPRPKNQAKCNDRKTTNEAGDAKEVKATSRTINEQLNSFEPTQGLAREPSTEVLAAPKLKSVRGILEEEKVKIQELRQIKKQTKDNNNSKPRNVCQKVVDTLALIATEIENLSERNKIFHVERKPQKDETWHAALRNDSEQFESDEMHVTSDNSVQSSSGALDMQQREASSSGELEFESYEPPEIKKADFHDAKLASNLQRERLPERIYFALSADSVDESDEKFHDTCPPVATDEAIFSSFSSRDKNKLEPMDTEDDAIIASPATSNTEASKSSKDSESDDKSTKLLLQEALEFKKALLKAQSEFEKPGFTGTKDEPDDSPEESARENQQSTVLQNDYKFLDIITEEQTLSSSSENTSRTYVYGKIKQGEASSRNVEDSASKLEKIDTKKVTNPKANSLQTEAEGKLDGGPKSPERTNIGQMESSHDQKENRNDSENWISLKESESLTSMKNDILLYSKISLTGTHNSPENIHLLGSNSNLILKRHPGLCSLTEDSVFPGTSLLRCGNNSMNPNLTQDSLTSNANCSNDSSIFECVSTSNEFTTELNENFIEKESIRRISANTITIHSTNAMLEQGVRNENSGLPESTWPNQNKENVATDFTEVSKSYSNLVSPHSSVYFTDEASSSFGKLNSSCSKNFQEILQSESSSPTKSVLNETGLQSEIGDSKRINNIETTTKYTAKVYDDVSNNNQKGDDPSYKAVTSKVSIKKNLSTKILRSKSPENSVPKFDKTKRSTNQETLKALETVEHKAERGTNARSGKVQDEKRNNQNLNKKRSRSQIIVSRKDSSAQRPTLVACDSIGKKDSVVEKKIRGKSRSKSLIPVPTASSGSCIQMLKSRLECARRRENDRRPRSPLRGPLTVTMLWRDKPCGNTVAAEGITGIPGTRNSEKTAEGRETKMRKDYIVEKPCDALESIIDGGTNNTIDSREPLVIYVNIFTKYDPIATRIVDPNKFLNYAKNQEKVGKKSSAEKVFGIVSSIVKGKSADTENPEKMPVSRSKSFPSVNTLLHDQLRNQCFLSVEQREIEVTAKPSVKDTSTSISDLHNVADGNPSQMGLKKFQICGTPRELNNDEYLALLEILNQESNYAHFRELQNLCKNLVTRYEK